MYILTLTASCLRSFTHLIRLADSLARASAGSNMLARIAMIAITTNNSIRVKALLVSCSLCSLFRFPNNKLVFIHFNFCFRVDDLEYFAVFSVSLSDDEKTLDAGRPCAGPGRHVALLEQRLVRRRKYSYFSALAPRPGRLQAQTSGGRFTRQPGPVRVQSQA